VNREAQPVTTSARRVKEFERVGNQAVAGKR